MGVSGRRYEKAKAVVESKNQEAIALMDKPGKVDRAYKLVTKPAKAPKPKPYPVSDEFVNWLSGTVGWGVRIRQEYGGMKALTGHKGWDPRRTDLVRKLLSGLTKTLTELKEELDCVDRT